MRIAHSNEINNSTTHYYDKYEIEGGVNIRYGVNMKMTMMCAIFSIIFLLGKYISISFREK